jgi:NTP pyrophosphatase (non-canonical NTP hydrolase)
MFKKGDRVLFDSQGTMYEGILVSNVYRVFTEKEIYADIYISAIQEQITVNIKYIKKIDEMKKINALEIHNKISIDELYNKLDEEVKEVASAILLNDIENLTEELLDVMQVVKGIAHKYNIDLDANIEKHNKKLLSRGHKFL